MYNDDPNEMVTMLNTRGRVVHVKKWEVPLCRQQGMRIIVNPKQEYYYEHDEENQRAIPVTENAVDDIDGQTRLEVEVV